MMLVGLSVVRALIGVMAYGYARVSAVCVGLLTAFVPSMHKKVRSP